MNEFFAKFLRVLSWILIVINSVILVFLIMMSTFGFYTFTAFGNMITGTSATVSIGDIAINTISLWIELIQKWLNAPFDFSNEIVVYFDITILMYLIPILILKFVHTTKKQLQKAL
ncbi:hypothetical protein BG261_08435 [Floricoccus tropicus]|uniref:Uncharacterized protein n=1 Tax=Floricoccus tropicus TaxID=1859473 RepID=A0A1E8GJ57_9LACT|nr:hypothetical protein [Floricoccus tropicus]OFI48300.1 hypothetical protein BG261_08435 [Floricoccus tropicus]